MNIKDPGSGLRSTHEISVLWIKWNFFLVSEWRLDKTYTFELNKIITQVFTFYTIFVFRYLIFASILDFFKLITTYVYSIHCSKKKKQIKYCIHIISYSILNSQETFCTFCKEGSTNLVLFEAVYCWINYS